MTHYQDKLEPYLHETYGEENVERDVFLDQTYRYVDFLVEVGDVYLAIEVENSTDHVVYEGHGQAELYAQHSDQYLPVIYYPHDGENEAELNMIGTQVGLVPFDFDEMEPLV